MRSQKIQFGFCCFLAAILLCAGFVRRHNARLFCLPDGSWVRLDDVRFGKSLRLYQGEYWQWPFYVVFQTNLPPQLVGEQLVFPSHSQTGSASVVFTRYVKRGQLSPTTLGSLRVEVLTARGERIPCVLKASYSMRKRAGGKSEVVSERMLWELPPVQGSKIKLQICYLDQKLRLATVKEFKIRNPMTQQGP